MNRKLDIVGFLLISVLLAVNCLSVDNDGILETYAIETKNTTTRNGSFVMGELTESSVLLKVYHLSTNASNDYVYLDLGGFTFITFIEGIDQNQNGTGGHLVYVLGGGLSENYLYFWFQSNFDDGIEFIINIYGEVLPDNSWSLGVVTPNSDVLFLRYVYVSGVTDHFVSTNVTFTYSGQPLITRIEAKDIGGGRVVQANWTPSQVTLFFESFIPSQRIYFEVTIYGERDDEQDFQIGTLNENSVLLFRQRVTVESAENQHVTSSVAVINEFRHFNSLIQVLNLGTVGTGSIVEIFDDGLNSEYLTLWLRSTVIGLGIDVWVNVYGDGWYTNFRRGEVTNHCRLLYTETIYKDLQPNESASVEYVNEDGAIITMVQGRDLTYYGTGGRLSSLTNGVGTNNVTVVIDAYALDYWSYYVIEIYGH